QSGQIVLGLEADGASSWIKESTIGTSPFFGNCGGAPPRCFVNLQALATVRGRAGLAMDNILPYLTGGLAVGSLHGEEAMLPPMVRSARVRPRSSAGPPVSGSRRCLIRIGRPRRNISTWISANARYSTTMSAA